MYYAKIAGNYTYWLVRNGKRQVMHNIAEVYSHGLAPVIVVAREVLDDIPITEE